MRTDFADTAYWIAITSRTDRHHQQARALRQSLQPVQLLTTDAVLLEFLAFFDCISMQIMRQHGLTEALTSDHHFAQEGFVVLIR